MRIPACFPSALVLFLSAPALLATTVIPSTTPLGSLARGLAAPSRVAVDAAGRILVTDTSAGRLVIFDSAGREVAVREGFHRPLGIAVGASGRLFLGEEGTGSVSAYDAEGTGLYSFGIGEGEFQVPNHIAVDSSVAGDSVYVVDSKASVVRLYLDGKRVTEFGGVGQGEGQFAFPTGICVSRDGTVYVVDQDNDRVQAFDRGGGFLRAMRLGRGGFFSGPSGRSQAVAIDSQDRLYIADSFQGAVKVLDAASGQILASIGTFGSNVGELNIPSGMALDSFGRLWVTSVNNGRVELFGVDAFVHVTVQPEAEALATGSALSLVAAAGGSSPLRFQWAKNGVALQGATDSTLRIAAVGVADSGAYSVMVSSADGAVTSGAAAVTVMDAPMILKAPMGRKVFAGEDVHFSVKAAGTGLRYQWQFNGWDLPGATEPSLELLDVQASQAGDYTVLVTSDVGSALSAPATLRVIVPPSRMEWESHWMGKDGTCSLIFNVDPGHTYVVEVTSDMHRWNVLTTVTPMMGRFQYTDAEAAGSPVRFYRLRWVPPE